MPPRKLPIICKENRHYGIIYLKNLTHSSSHLLVVAHTHARGLPTPPYIKKHA